MTEKVCSKCGRSGPRVHFWRDKVKKDGLRSSCSDCDSSRYGDYYEKNSVELKARSANWRQDNHERMLLNGCRARATKRSLPCTISADDIHVPTNCPVCDCLLVRSIGKLSDVSPTVDAYDPSQGYVPDNIWVICHGCNRRKSDMSGDGLLAFASKCISAFKEQS